MASSVSYYVSSEPLAEGTLPTVLVTPTTTTLASPTATAEDHVQDVNGLGSPVADEPPRPQAGPLPRKRGEIGFQEGFHDVPLNEGQASSSNISLPERHPADRLDPSSSELAAPPDDHPPRSPSRTESTNTANTTGKRSIISFFKPKRIPTYLGLRLTTLATVTLQLAALGATIAGWVITVQHMHSGSGSSSDDSDPTRPDGNGDESDSTQSGLLSSTSAQIFIHLAFGIVCLAQLIFLERTVFRLRAERYGHVHPGEILPSARTRASQERDMAIGFAPWNRPPLPTYAAALAQEGLGTGDVEDNIIAIPPPPAYGNTRGSTLLLQGFLSDTLRAQRPRSNGSTQSRASEGRSSRASRAEEGVAGAGEEEDRPKSYMSTDSEWEARLDADRVLVLEETLSKLEEGTARSSSRAEGR